MGKIKILDLGVPVVLLIVLCAGTSFSSPMTVLSFRWMSNFRPWGGFVDEIIAVVYSDVAQAMLALEQGGIDTYDDQVQTEYVGSLMTDPNIAVNVTLGTIYRQLTLNNGRFPTNITGYRRAMAYGMDKNRINVEAIGGNGAPLDTPIPVVATEWEVETTMEKHFYDKDIAAGNKSLENAGFIDIDGDGWREYAPDGNTVLKTSDECAIELGASSGYDPAIIACVVTAECLNEMGMKATVFEETFSLLLDNALAGNFWAIC
ncbi:MAG: ABC transporter substrate-binding protein [Candidatus Hodarchaeota archaeon]